MTTKRGPGRPPLGNSVRCCIVLTNETRRKLRRLAKRLGMSMSEYVRHIIGEAD